MTFKVVVSDPKTKKAYQKEVEEKDSGLLGKKIGDKFSGKILGLDGYEIEITGGSDKDGFPMRKDVSGITRKRILLAFGTGFHPKKKGQRKRKSIRGNTIAEDIAQINAKVVKYGAKSVAASFGVDEPKVESKKESKKKEEKPKAEEKKTEAKPAEKPKEEPKKESAAKEAKPEPKKEEAPKAEKKVEPKKEAVKEAKPAVEKKDNAPKAEKKPAEKPKKEEAPKAEKKE